MLKEILNYFEKLTDKREKKCNMNRIYFNIHETALFLLTKLLKLIRL